MAACLLALCLSLLAGAPARAAGLGPIRAAFFYPWYPTHWTSCGTPPCTKYSPNLGQYSSTSSAVISDQVRAMLYGRITAGIASWWGPGSREDRAMPALLAATRGTPFKWSLYYELEQSSEPSAYRIHKDLLYVRRRYSHDPGFLKVNGRMVVFVYASYAREGCSVVSKWERANIGIGAYLSISIVPGWSLCPIQPDSWHYYDGLEHREIGTASTGGNAFTGDSSFTISPGFYPYYDRSPACLGSDSTYPNLCLPRDPKDWKQNVADMVASSATWQLITTFNEWNEGTSIEEATGLRGWSSGSGYGTYLDALAASP